MNTYEKIVAFLKSYKKLEYDIEYFRNKMEGLKAISYSEEEKGTSMQDTMSLYMQKIEEAEKKQKEVELFIEKEFEGVERYIMYNRYIKSKNYQQISRDIKYSVSHTKRLHERAVYSYLSKHF